MTISNGVIFLLFLLFLGVYVRGYCEGEWRTFPSAQEVMDSFPFSSAVHAARSAHNPQKVAESNADWVKHACPAQVAIYTCYFHGNSSRAEALERRVYVPFTNVTITKTTTSTNTTSTTTTTANSTTTTKTTITVTTTTTFRGNNSNADSTCHPFDPFKLLEKLRNRTILFFGDSIMVQLIVHMFCSYYHLFPRMRYYVSYHGFEHHCNDIICPKPGTKEHSQTLNGWFYIPAYKATFAYERQSQLSASIFKTAYKNYHLTPQDIVVTNLAAHYNVEEKMEKDVEKFAQELLKNFYDYDNTTVSNTSDPLQRGSVRWKERLPPILYFEASPQHFHGVNGYYGQYTSEYKQERRCQEVKDPVARREADWRNRILERYLSFGQDCHSPIHLVRIAESLISQHDAHVEIVPFHHTPFDCTHWCFPSGIFNYLATMLYNGILRLEPPLKIEERPRHFYGLHLREGDIVKTHHDRSIYLLKDGKKCAFHSLDALSNRNYTLSDVKVTHSKILNDIPDGENLL